MHWLFKKEDLALLNELAPTSLLDLNMISNQSEVVICEREIYPKLEGDGRV